MKPKNVSDLTDVKEDRLNFHETVQGFDYSHELTLDTLIQSYATTGFQATNLYKAIQEVRRMKAANAKVFFGCTSNIISSGLREHVRYLAQNGYFHVMVCTAGGIEEDLIKCLKPTYLAEFVLDGKELRENGWNRIGNLVVNNKNYECFENWFNETMDELISGKTAEYPSPTKYTYKNPLILTPSSFINYLGKKINDESSVLYWCYKNGIKVFSPALTDGSIGDLLTFYNDRDAFKLDIVEDIYNINTESMGKRENGAIIVGCGLVKHHILNANLFNNGLEYCVLMNTANEFDGSDAGATLSEAYSWGKVKPDRTCVKVYGEASVLLPLLIHGGFVSK
ncbi:deoxyhypusine synthase [Pancytospora epiphaga]|nr:deoxyhypusine synthase [Pancytospora epiphaga]